MLNRILFAALAAALVAGLSSAALQAFTTTPLIIEAEKYEGAPDDQASHKFFDGGFLEAGGNRNIHQASFVLIAGDHADGEQEAWAPDDGLERTLFTSLSSIGMTFGFALILLSIMIISNERITARTGLLWGLAAFAATGLSPALGLSPELPGSAAAELEYRQVWWAGTAIATAAGLWLSLRVSTKLAIAAGLALIILPHVIGAPHPQEYTSRVPSEISGHFASSSLVVQAVTWVLTGIIAGYVWHRGESRSEAEA